MHLFFYFFFLFVSCVSSSRLTFLLATQTNAEDWPRRAATSARCWRMPWRPCRTGQFFTSNTHTHTVSSDWRALSATARLHDSPWGHTVECSALSNNLELWKLDKIQFKKKKYYFFFNNSPLCSQLPAPLHSSTLPALLHSAWSAVFNRVHTKCSENPEWNVWAVFQHSGLGKSVRKSCVRQFRGSFSSRHQKVEVSNVRKLPRAGRAF